MLSHRQRVAVRRHLGVPFANTAQAGRLFGWRFAIHVEDLEYKLNNLAPAEEQLITGNAMGSWQIQGSPTVGDVLTFHITDGNNIPAITYTVTSGDLNPAPNLINPTEASPMYSIAVNAAKAINAIAAQFGYAAATGIPADLFTPGALPYFSEVILTFAGLANATISASVTGTTQIIVGEQMSNTPIQATIQGTTYYGYCNVLDTLSMQISRADLSLWLTVADDAEFRKDEVAARAGVYRTYCEMLSRDLGGKAYIEHFFGGSSSGSIA